MKILLLFLVSFSLSANHHTNSKKVNIEAKLRESSPEGKVLSAPTMSMLTGTRSVIAVEQEKTAGKKQGFRMAWCNHQNLQMAFCWRGYAVYGTYDPEWLNKQRNLWLIFKGKQN
jgi:hypothetical protein